MNAIVMDIPGISGESKLVGFEGKIDVLAFGHGMAMQINPQRDHDRTYDNKSLHQDFVVTKTLDSASIPLNLACCSGKDLGTVQILVGQKTALGGLNVVIAYELSHVICATITISGGGDQAPMESVALNYSKIQWRYSPLAQGGAENAGGWDLVENRLL